MKHSLKAVGSLLLGLSFSGGSGMAQPAAPNSTAYLQLTFLQSASDCRAQKDASRMKDATSQCFSNASPPSDRRRLPDYLLQSASSTTALQPATGRMTFAYRALGPVQWAKDQKGADPAALGQGPVKFYQMMVFSNPASPAQEAAYNDWYDRQHVPDVIRNPGFISGQRFVRIDADKDKELQLPRYLVVFTLKSGDLQETNKEISARIRDGRTTMSPAFSTNGGAGIFATPLD